MEPAALHNTKPERSPDDGTVAATEQGGGAVKLEFATTSLGDPGPPQGGAATLEKSDPPRAILRRKPGPDPPRAIQLGGGASRPNPILVAKHDALLASKTSLIRAVETCDIDKVMEALAQTEDPTTTDLNGNNALHYAAADIKTKPEMIAALAAAGVDANAQATQGAVMGGTDVSVGYTPLHIAAANGCASNAAALVAAGASVRVQNTTTDEERNGQTPLHAMLCHADACSGFHEEVGRAREDAEALARTLLGDDVAQIRDAKGRTPLELAVESREYLITMFDGNKDRRFRGATGRATQYKCLEGAIIFLGGDPNPAATGRRILGQVDSSDDY